MKTIIHTVQIHAAPSKVYEALTTAQGLSRWWTTRVRVDPGEGRSIHFTLHGDFHPDMKQTRLERDRMVQWQYVGGHENWRENTFSFGLIGEGSETQLHFVQEYAQELTDSVYGVYDFNWGYYLNSLKQYLESGAGVPFVPPS